MYLDLGYSPVMSRRPKLVLIPDPITLHVVVGSCPVIAFEQLDQGSVQAGKVRMTPVLQPVVVPILKQSARGLLL